MSKKILVIITIATLIIASFSLYLFLNNRKIANESNQDEIVEPIDNVNEEKGNTTKYTEYNITNKDEYSMEIDFEVINSIDTKGHAVFTIEIFDEDPVILGDFIKGFEYFIFDMNPDISSLEIKLYIDKNLEPNMIYSSLSPKTVLVKNKKTSFN